MEEEQVLLTAASSVPLVSSPSVCACVRQDSSKDCVSSPCVSGIDHACGFALMCLRSIKWAFTNDAIPGDQNPRRLK